MHASPSHIYAFKTSWLLRHLTALLGGLAGLWVLLSLGRLVIPGARDTWDMDRTIMAYKVDLASAHSNPEIILIGDSSCLMNVDASLLSSLTGMTTLNLGTLSFLSLESYALLLEHGLKNQSNPPKHVILLTHPDFLRRQSPSLPHVHWMEEYLLQSGSDASERSTFFAPSSMLSWEALRSPWLNWIPRPLSGEFRKAFGFDKRLEQFMSEHKGSAYDPRTLQSSDLLGSKEYFVSKINMETIEKFVSILPKSTKLWTRITPMPESFAQPNVRAQLETMNDTWEKQTKSQPWSVVPPMVLSDEKFASKTHLANHAVASYTEIIANNLALSGPEE